MFFHSEFDRNLLDKIGLWFSRYNLVGIARYDHYLGEAFFAARKDLRNWKKIFLIIQFIIFVRKRG